MEIKWPLKPTHISNDKTELFKTAEGKEKGYGIIANQYLRGMLTELAANMKNPVTVHEFPVNENEELVITETKYYPDNLRKPCLLFRNGKGIKYCQRGDCFHSILFRSLREEDIEREVKKRISEESFISKYEKKFNRKPSVYLFKEDKSNRFYLEYDCPFLGYKELIFPIIIEGYITGVISYGELVLEGSETNIKNIREEFYKKHGHELESTNTENGIAAADQAYRMEPDSVIRLNEFDKLKYDVIEKILEFEKRLTNELTNQRKEYIAEKFEKYDQDFRGQVFQTHLIGNEGLKSFWLITESILNSLNEDFQLQGICIFGLKEFDFLKPRQFELVTKTKNMAYLSKGQKFSLRKQSKLLFDKIITSKDLQILSDNFQPPIKYDPDEDLIQVFPSTSSLYNMIIIWIKYEKSIWTRLNNNAIINQYFKNKIFSFYSVLFSTHSSIWAATTSDFMESILMIQRHQTGQILSGIDSIRMVSYSSPEELRKLSDEKLEDINRDLQGFINRLRVQGEQIKQILSETLEVKKEYFPIFSELIFKWNQSYRLEIGGKKCQVILPKVSMHDLDRPDVFADEVLMDQLVANLFDNAVKYSERGTNIYIDCKKENQNIYSSHLLTFISYGFKIDSEINIYGLFSRTKGTEQISGRGIGLYIAKKIIEAHGGDIKHLTSELICDYNLPLLKRYVEKSNEWGLNDQKIIETYYKIKNTPLYHEVISLTHDGVQRYNPTKHTVIKLINKPIFKNTFIVTIPAKGDHK